ncbi:MAG: helix-turn-helix domain-containing protein [Clostridia bacterium]|nr:helix-turn-helix domain-containing protein [Clostridia bacterium]
MGKRQTFYTRADLFEARISPRAKLVLTYLSRVSDKQGLCFPSVPTIAEKCGCCQNTARKALRELERAGFIAIAAATLPTEHGRQRRTSNRYTLLFVPSKNEGTPLQPAQGAPSPDEGPVYNSKLTMDVPKGHSQSVNATDPDRDTDRGEKGLGAILFRLHLDLYEDETFAKSVRHALRRMYHSESIRVKGETIPRDQVRGCMELLTIDHIDFVQRQLREATSSVTCGERFLISCLYNAPLDCMAKSRCG